MNFVVPPGITAVSNPNSVSFFLVFSLLAGMAPERVPNQQLLLGREAIEDSAQVVGCVIVIHPRLSDPGQVQAVTKFFHDISQQNVWIALEAVLPCRKISA